MIYFEYRFLNMFGQLSFEDYGPDLPKQSMEKEDNPNV